MRKKAYTYINFREVPNGKRKTRKFHCLNNSSGGCLGIVKWASGWRRYCFYPEPCSQFSKGCMEDICHFIKTIEEMRAALRKMYERCRCEYTEATWHRYRTLEGPWSEWMKGKPDKCWQNREYDYRHLARKPKDAQ